MAQDDVSRGYKYSRFTPELYTTKMHIANTNARPQNTHRKIPKPYKTNAMYR